MTKDGRKRHILCCNPMPEKTSDVPFIAMDFENDGKRDSLDEGFECACAYGEIRRFKTVRNAKGKKETVITVERVDEVFYTRKEAIDFVLSIRKFRRHTPCHLVFFNGGYDYPFIRPACKDKQLMMSGQFIMGMTLHGIKIWDIQRHATTGSLGDWMKTLKMDVTDGVFKRPLEDKVARCRDDAKATWILTEYFKKRYNEMGINMKLTMAATALSYFTHVHMFKDDGTPLMFERYYEEWGAFARESYYGGRAEVFMRNYQVCESFDINSTYVSVMRDEILPDPQSIKNEVRPKEWRGNYENYLGILDVTVKVPMMRYPPLPVRTQTKKLIFPVGTFRGVWTTVDLKAAESQGCEILEVHRHLYFTKSLPLLHNFAVECWDNRQNAVRTGGKGCVDEKFWKTFGNSLYGKLAQRVPIGGYVGKLSEFKEKPPVDSKIWEEDGEEYITFPAHDFEESNFAFVELSSFIAAYARVKLMDAVWKLEKAGYLTIYVDTDSIKITNYKRDIGTKFLDHISKIIPVGKDLGQWKYEGSADGYFFRPKWYCEVIEPGNSKKAPVLKWYGENSKMKGVGKKAEIYDEVWIKIDHRTWVLQELKAKEDRPFKIKESARSGGKKPVNHWRSVSKTLVNDDTKREWFGDESLPVTWDSNLKEIVPSEELNYKQFNELLGR
jgi:hypothetical protein